MTGTEEGLAALSAVLTDRTCEACGSPEVEPLFSSARTGLRAGRCRDCRLVAVLDPPGEAELIAQYASTPDYDDYLAAQRSESLHVWRGRTLDRLTELTPGPDRRLFDVGAGAGDFLALARDRGFSVTGSELSEPAAELCRRKHGIALHLADLRHVPGRNRVDAMTMWCVLAHVADPVGMLSDALRLLRPGGVLFLHTPRWCLLDAVGLAALRGSGGRLSQLTDRRTNLAHLRMYGVPSFTRLLRRVGFEPISVRPAVGYSLNTDSYLADLGIPERVAGPLSRGFDALIERRAFVRNVLEVYARKPAG